jgi:addiction module HigA family antidote
MSDKVEPMHPIHPGEILREKFLKPLGISVNQLARDLDVPPDRISMIINGKRAITANTAVRLAAYFDTAPEAWLSLQNEYEIRLVRKQRGDELSRRVRRRAT